MQIVSKEDTLHEMLKPISRKNKKKNIVNLSSVELTQGMVNINVHFDLDF